MNIKKILIALIFGTLSGCANTCNDYANSLLGPPPGCECLYNAYGCGPFETPSGYGFRLATSSARTTPKVQPTLTVNLNQKSSSCPNLKSKISFKSVIQGSGNILFVYVPGVGSVRLNKQGRIYKGNLNRSVPLIPACSFSATITFQPTSSPANGGRFAVQGAVNCSGRQMQSCKFSYQGSSS